MTRTYIILALCLTAVFGMAIYSKTRPDPELLRFEVAGDVAYGYGTTTERSIGQIGRFIAKNPDVKTLVFRKMPGTRNTVSNAAIGRKIRRAGLSTHLESGSVIASGAVDLFLAGAARTMDCGARIGVHSWGSPIGYGAQDALWDTHQTFHEDYLRDMGINPEFYAFTRSAAPPESIYWLTYEDIKRFDLLTDYPDCA